MYNILCWLLLTAQVLMKIIKFLNSEASCLPVYLSTCRPTIDSLRRLTQKTGGTLRLEAQQATLHVPFRHLHHALPNSPTTRDIAVSCSCGPNLALPSPTYSTTVLRSTSYYLPPMLFPHFHLSTMGHDQVQPASHPPSAPPCLLSLTSQPPPTKSGNSVIETCVCGGTVQ